MAAGLRSILGVLVDPAEGHPGSGSIVSTPTLNFPIGMPLRKVIGASIGMHRFIAQQQREAAASTEVPPLEPPAEPEPAAEPDPDAYELFDTEGNLLSPASTIGELPRPGVVIMVARSLRDSEASTELGIVAYAAWREVEGSPIGQRHLGSGGARVEPIAGYTFDVFLSYSTVDEATAGDLRDQLSALGLRVFLASKSIDAGNDWSDTLREALRGARMAIVLLTPASIKSPWVMCEAGACWALGKPVVPAMAYVKPGKLPGPLGQYQARAASSPSQIAALAKEVALLCGEEAPDE